MGRGDCLRTGLALVLLLCGPPAACRELTFLTHTLLAGRPTGGQSARVGAGAPPAVLIANTLSSLDIEPPQDLGRMPRVDSLVGFLTP